MDDRQNNTVLVTGGRGFLGRTVVNSLAAAGCTVVSLDQAGASSAPLRRSHEVLADITDAVQLRRVFESEKIWAVVHLAAILPTASQHDPLRATRVNVEGSQLVLETARQSGVRRIIFGSSLSVYGTRDADTVVSEVDPAAPEDLYGAGKLYVERLGEAYSSHYGMEFASLRIGRVVGPGAQSQTSAWRSQIFERLGTDHAAQIALAYVPAERLLLIHVEDVGRMLVRMVQASWLQHSVYNAPCESVIVSDLKQEVEALNPHLRIHLGEALSLGNPRQLDSERFQRELGVRNTPIFERLRALRDQARSEMFPKLREPSDDEERL
jgi:nucleoside-diphosphate-sugar epimerase